VTTGFTAGIATVIATIQLKDFFGLHPGPIPEGFFGRVSAYLAARHTFSPVETTIGAATLLLLIVWPRLTKRIPAPLVALTAVTIGALVAKKLDPSIDFATIGNRFGGVIDGRPFQGIPQRLPEFALPWNVARPGDPPFAIGLKTIEAILPSAFAIAMLGAIESLLSAVVSDGMAQTRHDPDAELIALGIGNLVCPFFGGIAATGAIARTATNIRFGSRSPLSAVVHAVFILLSVLLLAPWLAYLPMASLAALLMLVAYNMAELRHFKHILRVAPKSDVGVLLICFSLTVTFDMVIGVSVGVVLAAILFMHRMAEVTAGQKLVGTHHYHTREPIPPDVFVYEISGPFFFGATEKATSAIREVDGRVRTVIFLMENVPAMDVTGLVAFETAISRLASAGCRVFLVGVKPQPARVMERSGLMKRVESAATLTEAVSHATGPKPATHEHEHAGNH
jgi:SulP family sulfate permease